MNHDRRILNVPGLLNARDLGGLPVAGGGQTEFRRVFRGPMLDILPKPGVDALINELGIRRELDVRDETSGARGAESLLAKQVEERFQIGTNHPEDQARQSERFAQDTQWDHADDYLQAMDRSPGVPRILSLLADSSGHPTYVHCSVGKDRTGTIVGLVLDAIGVERDVIIEDYALSGRDIEEWFATAIERSERAREVFGSANPRSFASFKSADPANMAKMLDGIKARWGSGAKYVLQLENGDAILEGLRRKLLAD